MDKAEIREKVIAEISKTEETIKEYKAMTKPVSPDVAIGRISRMDAINNKSVAEAALREAEIKLNKLNRVMLKIPSIDFGICLKCKKQIPLGRILIRPESLHCVNCAK